MRIILTTILFIILTGCSQQVSVDDGVFGAGEKDLSKVKKDLSKVKLKDLYDTSIIKDKYIIKNASLIKKRKDVNDISIEVGDKTKDIFEPKMTIKKWGDEVLMVIGVPDKDKVVKDKIVKTKGIEIISNKIVLKDADIEYHYYEVDENNYEYEIILNAIPETNIIEIPISSEGLVFNYQDELTQQEIDDGATRPENVIGSYAVMHATKKGHRQGYVNYGSGKAFHIYRPKIIDINNDWVWGDINIANDLMTITIPQIFIDNADYPIIIDPTFGYETEGGTNWNWGNDNIRVLSGYTPLESGNISNINVYTALSGVSANGFLRPVVYKTSDNTLVGVGKEFSFTLPVYTTFGWKTLNTDIDIIADTGYDIGVWQTADNSKTLYFKYDTDASYDTYRDNTVYHATNNPPSTLTKDTTYSTRNYTVYAQYWTELPSITATSSVINNTTLSHTTESDTDILVVCVGTHQGTISNVQFDGDAMTLATSSASQFNETSEIWYTKNPTAKTGNITMTAGGSGDSIIAMNVKDAETTAWTPIVRSIQLGDSSEATLDITTVYDESLVIDCEYSEPVPTMGALQTEIDILQNNSYENAAASTEPKDTAGTVTMSWDLSYGSRWALSALVLEPVRSVGGDNSAPSGQAQFKSSIDIKNNLIIK